MWIFIENLYSNFKRYPIHRAGKNKVLLILLKLKDFKKHTYTKLVQVKLIANEYMSKIILNLTIFHGYVVF